ncbi:MAG TPA: TorF family putative porin [Paucimonas sp.]|nr:TorF family putative porin [Paucimonas sp.]HJW56585.1 TorF family putative porin [Burkholderiaceae bacterium]
MKHCLLAVAFGATLTAGVALAQEAKPVHEFSLNAAITSDYRYRGISQTRLQPALQGGADYTHNPSGLYAGVWLSTIKWTKDAGGDGDVEVDLYAGRRGALGDKLSYDAGVLSYVYPSNDLQPSANTTEVYGQLGFGPAYVKYSLGLTNLFGYADSRHSGYLDLGANLDLAQGLVLNLHAGHQNVKGNAAASYTDWKIGLTRDFGVATGALALVGTNADRVAYASPVNGKFMGRNAVTVSISKTF